MLSFPKELTAYIQQYKNEYFENVKRRHPNRPDIIRSLMALRDEDFARLMVITSKKDRGEKLSALDVAYLQEIQIQIDPNGVDQVVKSLKEQGLIEETFDRDLSHLRFLSEEENSKIFDLICKSKPSDRIVLDNSSFEYLEKMWVEAADNKELKFGRHVVPSDLFFSGTVPLLDCEQQRDTIDGRIVTDRVVIFENYQDIIRNVDGEDDACVGAVVSEQAIIEERSHKTIDCKFVLPIICRRKSNILIIPTTLGYSKLPVEYRDTIAGSTTFMQLYDSAVQTLGYWYAIQITLLHPDMKEVFSHPRTIVRSSNNSMKDKKQRKVKYIRYHVIREVDIINTVSSSANFHRKTMAWYVIGHWRHYQDGSVTFVNGHWKGALKHLKENLDAGRERMIDTPDQ